MTFLIDTGFTVVAERTMDIVSRRLQGVTPADIADNAIDLLASVPSAEGIYIPCGQWPAADAAPLIEYRTKVPAVTGSYADHWEAFRTLGIYDSIHGHGRLMKSLSKMKRVARAPPRRLRLLVADSLLWPSERGNF